MTPASSTGLAGRWPAGAAFAAALLGIALFSVMDAMMKSLVLAIGAYTTLLWRNLAGVVISGAVFFARPRQAMTTSTLRVHCLRGAVSTGMSLAFFWGLARMPMAQAVALTFIAPLLSLFLAAALLRERVQRATVLASAIAFVGVTVILYGQWRSEIGPEALEGAIAVLASAFLYAFNIVLMRRQAQIADPMEVAFSQSAVVTLLLLCGSPFFADLPPPAEVPMLVAAAVLTVASLMLLAWAYARSDAARLSTTEYSSFLWAAALGWMFFDERVTGVTLAGAALIVVGCVLAARVRVAGVEATA